jgi:hypothetical protein
MVYNAYRLLKIYLFNRFKLKDNDKIHIPIN